MATAPISSSNGAKGTLTRSSINAEAIPQELRDLPQWVTWRFVQRNGNPKPTKAPTDPATGKAASATDPATWSSFEEALTSHRSGQGDGIGFVFAPGDPYTGIDLDHCHDDEGNLVDWAEDLVARFDSYTELSPSGLGLHIIIEGRLPGRGRRKGSIEMYSDARYFTMTGVVLEGAPMAITERSEMLDEVYQEIFAEDDVQWTEPRADASYPVIHGGDGLISRAMKAKNGAKFQKLWRGDWSDYGSPSGADLGLCNHLHFWTGGDTLRRDRLFRQSGLMRSKWDERHGDRTYGQMTIDKARSDTYSRPEADPMVVQELANSFPQTDAGNAE